jgi:hypothetical protein
MGDGASKVGYRLPGRHAEERHPCDAERARRPVAVTANPKWADEPDRSPGTEPPSQVSYPLREVSDTSAKRRDSSEGSVACASDQVATMKVATA